MEECLNQQATVWRDGLVRYPDLTLETLQRVLALLDMNLILRLGLPPLVG